MGLFDIFRKKEEEPVKKNNPNSVFTLKFAVPYFPVFDKTNPKISAFPVRISVGGNVQYRISEPDLCFDNVPLGEMSAEQLEAHVKDSLTVSIKHFINTIDYLPLLQFETELMAINQAAKEHLVPLFEEEYGLNLRAFTLSRLSYDEEDENYIRVKTISEKRFDHEQNLEDKERERQLRKTDILNEEELLEREQEIERRKVEHELHVRKAYHTADIDEEKSHIDVDRYRQEVDEDMYARRVGTDTDAHVARLRAEKLAERGDEEYKIDLERKRREMEEDMYARRKATDAGAKLADSLSKRSTPKLGDHSTPSLGANRVKKDDDLDLGSL